LNEGCTNNCADDDCQFADLMLIHHVVDQVARRDRDSEAAEAVNDY
jgi:hypothetical protein